MKIARTKMKKSRIGFRHYMRWKNRLLGGVIISANLVPRLRMCTDGV
jgi:hypothetical protein